MAKQRDPMAKFIDQAIRSAGDAVAQARTELIDRGWFGRHPYGTGPHHSSMSQQLGWTQPGTEEKEPEKAKAWDLLCGQIVREIGRDDAHAIERGKEKDQDQDIDL